MIIALGCSVIAAVVLAQLSHESSERMDSEQMAIKCDAMRESTEESAESLAQCLADLSRLRTAERR